MSALEVAAMTHFYLVWNPAGPYGGHPTVRHDTLDSARREAERLASLHPGQEFHVLRSVGTARNVAVQYVEHDKECALAHSKRVENSND